jgi:hypothetical protein
VQRRSFHGHIIQMGGTHVLLTVFGKVQILLSTIILVATFIDVIAVFKPKLFSVKYFNNNYFQFLYTTLT